MSGHIDTHTYATFPEATREDIARVADLGSKPPKARSTHKGRSDHAIDIAAFVKEHEIQIQEVEEKDGATYYHLEHCLFNPEHEYKDAAFIVYEDGSVVYKCFHDSCSDKGLRDVIQLYKAGSDKVGSDLELFHDQFEEAYARFFVKGHWEIMPIKSKQFKAWFANTMVGDSGNAPSGSRIEDELRLIEFKCLLEAEEHELFVRVAPCGDSIWVDLADPMRRAIEVTTQGWRITDPPILFYRYRTNSRQVEPVPGGSLQMLRSFLNVRDEDAWVLIQAWIIAAFIPTIPHPILVVYGEQGTAKTTHMVILSSLIDPSKVGVGAEPERKMDWIQAADHRYLVTLDNVTHLPQWLSDCLCRAVTGEAFSKRRLYTDTDDVLFSFRRVIALTGIQQVAQKPDLLDRAILHGLEPIPPSRRKLEAEVLQDFEEVRPAILGAILDILSQVMAELPNVKLKSLPRMADFARVGVAVERVLGWREGVFLDAYGRNIRSQHEEALDASSIAQAVRTFMIDEDEWKGTSGELLDTLTDVASTDSRLPCDWPKTARGLSGKLRENAPNLRHIGINVSFRSSNGRRLVVLTKQE